MGCGSGRWADLSHLVLESSMMTVRKGFECLKSIFSNLITAHLSNLL